MLTEVQPRCPECEGEDIRRFRNVLIVEVCDLALWRDPSDGSVGDDVGHEYELSDQIDAEDPVWRCYDCDHETDDPYEFVPTEEDEDA